MVEAVSIVYSVYTHVIPHKCVTYLTRLKDLSLNTRTDGRERHPDNRQTRRLDTRDDPG